MTHHDAVRRRRSPEYLRHAPGRKYTVASFPREAVEVGIARRDVTEQARNADHRPSEVVIVKTDGSKHGPIGGPANTAGGKQAMSNGVLWHEGTSEWDVSTDYTDDTGLHSIENTDCPIQAIGTGCGAMPPLPI
jgi:hypothetical protein